MSKWAVSEHIEPLGRRRLRVINLSDENPDNALCLVLDTTADPRAELVGASIMAQKVIEAGDVKAEFVLGDNGAPVDFIALLTEAFDARKEQIALFNALTSTES